MSYQNPRPRPASRLVVHDVRIGRQEHQGQTEVVARVECERRTEAVLVEECLNCPRFVRIEPHEAGYVALCRSADISEEFEL